MTLPAPQISRSRGTSASVLVVIGTHLTATGRPACQSPRGFPVVAFADCPLFLPTVHRHALGQPGRCPGRRPGVSGALAYKKRSGICGHRYRMNGFAHKFHEAEIIVEDMASMEDLGNYSCPDLPRKPDPPRFWDRMDGWGGSGSATPVNCMARNPLGHPLVGGGGQEVGEGVGQGHLGEQRGGPPVAVRVEVLSGRGADLGQLLVDEP